MKAHWHTPGDYFAKAALDPLRFDEAGVIHAKATRGTEQPAP